MMKTDYKFKFIIRDGKTTKCRVAFYEGDITTEPEFGKNVTRYRRTKLLRTEDFEFQGDLSEQQLVMELNKELAKDTLRVAIDKQKNAQIF